MSSSAAYFRLFVVYFTIMEYASCLQFHTPYKTLPKIRLSSYREADSLEETTLAIDDLKESSFRDDFVSQNGSDYTIFDGVLQVSFVCEAEYPVTWTFPHPIQIPVLGYNHIRSIESRATEFSSNSESPTNLRYFNTIIIKFSKSELGIKFLKTNINCSSTEENVVAYSSISVHLRGDEALENSGRLIRIQHSFESLSPVVLPCRSTYSYTNVILESVTIQEHAVSRIGRQQWDSFSPNSSYIQVDYSPHTGFTLTPKTTQAVAGIFGVFRCSLDRPGNKTKLPKDFIYFYVYPLEHDPTGKVIDDDPIITTVFPARKKLSGSASVILDRDTMFPNIICCTGMPNKTPRLYIHPSSSTAMSKLLAPVLESKKFVNSEEYTSSLTKKSKDCASRKLYGNVEMAICSSDNVDYAETFVAVFYPWTSESVDNRTSHLAEERSKVWKTPRLLQAFNSLTYRVPSTNVTVAQKMTIFVARYSTSNLRSLQLLGNLGVRFGETSAKMDTLLSLNSGSPYIRTYVDLVEYNRDFYYASEPLLFVCLGVAHFYSTGAQLAVTWMNGTKTVLPKPEQESELERYTRVLYLAGSSTIYGGSGSATEALFREPVIADINLRSVECWMPVKESSKWEKLSKNLKIIPSVPPRFKEELKEIMYVDVDDTEINVTCTIVNGKPFPRYAVTWQEKRVRLYDAVKVQHLKDPLNLKLYQLSFPRGLVLLNKTETFIKIVVTFEKMKLEYQGEIQCIAQNANSTVTRTVNIIVAEKSRHAGLSIMIGVSSLLAVILAGIFAKHFLSKRRST